MSAKSGRAGASTRGLAEYRNLLRIALGLAALAVAWIFWQFLPHAQHLGFVVVAALLVAFKLVMSLLERKIGTKIREEKQAVRGAVAEEKIGGLLDQLGGELRVLHDVPCPFGNIDHVVVSKDHGVFLIETKAHGGRVAVVDSKIRVNGRLPEKDFVAQTLRNTYWLVEQIKGITGIDVWVNPLLVFTNAFVAPSRPLKGITITNQKFLASTVEGTNSPLPARIWEAREELLAALAPAH